LGRFGWKANQPSLLQQTAAAANGDMGLTSTLFPSKPCTAVEQDCAAAPRGQQPELSDARLADVVAYLAGLAVPDRRDAEAPAVRRGEALFAAAGCDRCHAPTWVTAGLPGFPELAGQTIHPYSDLLLHDLGSGLADGRPDHLAGRRDWRTPPLWGIGLARQVNPAAGYLHDGRARTLLEAILWHGGEAKPARDRVARLPAEQRNDLLAFLNSL
jgi:CxxC motif-containing protein (DUF1111 family)